MNAAASPRVLAAYQTLHALCAASPTLQRIHASTRAQAGVASPDGTITQVELDWLA